MVYLLRASAWRSIVMSSVAAFRGLFSARPRVPTFESSIVIAAEAGAVGSVLSDVANWPNWLPTVTKVEPLDLRPWLRGRASSSTSPGSGRPPGRSPGSKLRASSSGRLDHQAFTCSRSTLSHHNLRTRRPFSCAFPLAVCSAASWAGFSAPPSGTISPGRRLRSKPGSSRPLSRVARRQW